MNKIETAFRRGSTENPVFTKYFRKCQNIQKTYAILMTPRTGSTWLTHEIASYRVLGHPDEYFIADIFDQSVDYNPSSNIYEYYDVVAKKMSSGENIFGFEISYHDLEELEKEADLLSLMTGERYFIYLTRKNFVAQSISLHIASESGFYHLTNKESPEGLHTRSEIPYDAEKIRHWCSHILQQEYGFNQWISAKEISVLKIEYEDMVENMTSVIFSIAAHVGVELNGIKLAAHVPRTVRVTASYSNQYEQKFRSEYNEWCRFWEQGRGLEECLL